MRNSGKRLLLLCRIQPVDDKSFSLRIRFKRDTFFAKPQCHNQAVIKMVNIPQIFCQVHHCFINCPPRGAVKGLQERYRRIKHAVRRDTKDPKQLFGRRRLAESGHANHNAVQANIFIPVVCNSGFNSDAGSHSFWQH